MGKHRKQPAGRSYGDGKGPGYKNIDRKHGWLKGCPSPNPSGRPRKPPPTLQDKMLEDVVELLTSIVPAAPGERLTVHQALLRRLAAEGINDGKMAAKVLPLLVHHMRTLRPQTPVESNVAEDDVELIGAAIGRLARAGGSAND